jgi:hypothetical protein
MEMTLSTDQLVEAFSAKLVERGRPVIHLNEDEVRLALHRVHALLQQEIDKSSSDPEWRRSLVKFRNLFAPSSIGAFDDFETLMRSKQIYMTDHPNPYYQYIAIRIPTPIARVILNQLQPRAKQLVDRLAETFLAAA